MTSLPAPWWTWMAAMSVQILVVVAVVALLERLLARRVRPRLALALWLVALAKLATPPSLGSPVSLAHLAPAGLDAAAPPPGWIEAAFWTWLAGVAACGAFAILRYRRIRRQLLEESVARDPIRDVPARVSPQVTVPCVLGFFRPIILLPAGPVPDAALLHELAHVRRRDPLLALVATAIQILYWFHPAAWLIRSRLATLREVACDAEAARALGNRAPEYRRMLLDLARTRVRPTAGVSGLACRILERLEWTTGARSTRFRGFVAGAVAVIILAACVPLARPSLPFAFPKLEETQGCLQRRFVVYEALCRQP